MEDFATTVTSFQLIFVAKLLILDVCRGPDYASDLVLTKGSKSSSHPPLSPFISSGLFCLTSTYTSKTTWSKTSLCSLSSSLWKYSVKNHTHVKVGYTSEFLFDIDELEKLIIISCWSWSEPIKKQNIFNIYNFEYFFKK